MSNLPPDEIAFQLTTLPADLLTTRRVAQEFQPAESVVWNLVREGKFAGPSLRRRGRVYWDPAMIERQRNNWLHRIGVDRTGKGRWSDETPRPLWFGTKL
jgi:hypothetical protein